jgi:N-acetylmuramoyl-L-alanine amidase
MRGLVGLLTALASLFSKKNTDEKPSAVTVSDKPKPYTGYSIVIDPGHGGRNGKRDPGAVGRLDGEEVYERNVVLEICKQLAFSLDALGFRVLMTRIDNEALSHLKDKVDIVIKEQPDIFVSVHANANAGTPAQGIETFYNKNRAESKNLADKIQKSLMAAFPSHRNRGIKDGSRLYVLRKQEVKACCLVECEFINHPEQVKFLVNKPKEVAKAILEGITSYLDEEGV